MIDFGCSTRYSTAREALGLLQPLLLVLEDLHDADRGTLDLLVYLARHLAGTALLVVGTYRDVEVDRAHPLGSALAELRRGSHFERIQLGELSVDDVQGLLAAGSQQVVPRPLAELVHHRAGGNALFTHQLLRFLLSERLVERHGVLRRVGEASLVGKMPEGLRDVVGKRLSRLSLEARCSVWHRSSGVSSRSRYCGVCTRDRRTTWSARWKRQLERRLWTSAWLSAPRSPIGSATLSFSNYYTVFDRTQDAYGAIRFAPIVTP
jgi:hypothetical protein